MTNNPADTLKACPFCGGSDLRLERCGTDDECTFIHCNSCEAGGPTSTPRADKCADDEWNTRAPSEKPTGDMTLEDVIAWADGIQGTLGTEYANRVTENEAYISDCVLRGYKNASSSRPTGDRVAALEALKDKINIKIKAGGMVESYYKSVEKDASYSRGKISALLDVLDLIDEMTHPAPVTEEK